MDTTSDDPTMSEVLTLMSAEAPAPSPEPAADSATEAQRAGQEVISKVPSPIPVAADALATAEPAKPAEQVEPEKPKPEVSGSKFEKNQQRLQGGWKALNEEKTAIQKERDSIKLEREELTRKAKEFEVAQQQASQPQYTADQVDGFAAEREREAKALEEAGKYDEADRKRFKAEEFREWAKQLRANPPKPIAGKAELEAKHLEEQKQWWAKAAIDFPACAKADTTEAKALKALIEANPETFRKYPDAMYWSARLVTAETAAARVSALDKELGELRAKVKDLNEQLAIPGDGAAGQPQGEVEFKNLSPEAQRAEMLQLAAAQDAG